MMKIHISQTDTFFANGSYPIEFLSYYKNGLHTGKVRKALHKLSSAFWPMFGEYHDGVIHFETYTENACFEETVLNQKFDPLQAPEMMYQTYCHAIPDNLSNLFFLKIIQYHNGTVIIPKLNHLAGDGYSYFYFLFFGKRPYNSYGLQCAHPYTGKSVPAPAMERRPSSA